MLEDGLSYPLKGDNAVGRIAIGGVLSYLAVLLFPLFLLMGYFVRVLAASARGEEEPPAFDEWGNMFVEGLKASVVAVVYGVVPFLLVAVAVVFAGVGLSSGNDAAAGVLGGLGVVGLLFSVGAMFAIYYLVPAALTNMGLEGSLGAAFDVDTLSDVLLSTDYLVAWLLPFALALVVNLVTTVLVVVTFGLGALVVPFVQFYVQVSVFYMFGRAFGSVTSTPSGGAASPDAAV